MLKGAENKNHLSTVRLVVLGGQDILRLDFDLYKEYFNDQCIFVNCFGSSEMYLASFNIINKNTEITRDSIPIGNAVKGVKIKLVNENGETPNIYEIGELIFESEYLTPGYLNFDNSSLNFNKKQSKKTCFIFKSGDLARLLPDGAIEFGGRRDNQIKIRGNRVELKEIENALNELPEIKQSIIVVEKDDANEVLLIAYCETDINQNVTESLARQYLWTKLPDYMMPSEFKFVERFPLNENGKIDFKKLVEACEKYEFFEPEGEIEEKLVAIWKEVLEIEKVSVKDSFLKLGGNSLSAIAILNRIHQIFDRYLSIRDIFMNPSIRELAGIISNVGEEEKLINDILAEIENNN
jgi:acyl-coenzyme A synthetase/AMP-(fatty) acid ligase